MEEKYKMYSEKEYINKMQLKNIYSNTASDMIYEEIQAYRSFYKYDLMFHKRHYYVTCNPTLIKMMTRIYELGKEVSSQENVWGAKEMKDWLHLFETSTKEMLNPLLVKFLCGNDPFLIKFFVLHYIACTHEFLYHFLQFYHKEHWLSIALKIDKIKVEYKDDLDLSYEFRYFLENLYLHLSVNMVPLTGRCFCSKHSREELKKLYPRLDSKAIDFYFSHSQPHCHYTISSYMKYCQVSYETARQRMQLFLDMKWYQRLKVGKKFVYVPTL